MFGADDESQLADRQWLQKLEAFYEAVIDLTINHDTLTSSQDGVEDYYAVVFPKKLGAALEKVDPEWYKNA